jgi:phosphotransferase system HPr (HPr) family protein
MSDTYEKILLIEHPAGLHLRPAALFVKTAARFQSQITLTNLSREGSPEANAKSMFGLMQSGVSQGHQVRVAASGSDATEALAALEELVRNNFEEQESAPRP